jgi:SAM-dependent methyltransferase
MSSTKDPTQRFSDRVGNYARYRPGYPAQALAVLKDDAGLVPASIIADIGSGTGISTKLFLDHGNTVYAVEPNRPMREAAEELLSAQSHFHSIDGSAECTTLADRAVDFIVAGQAFHWFDRARARVEFARILRSGGYVVLMWNERRLDATPFLRDYEALICEFAVDYQQVDHRNIGAALIAEFFAPDAVSTRRLDNHQTLDRAGLLGRIASSSYMPADNHPRRLDMVRATAQLFERHERCGGVIIEYDTVLYYGRLAGGD